MKQILFVLALCVSGCVFKPVPVKLNDVKGKDYVLACTMYLQNGPYKKKWVGIVLYDSAAKKKKYEPVYRVLVDDRGSPMVFGSQMDLLNFLSKEGWAYKDTWRLEVMKNVKRDFMMLEERQ